MTPRPKIAETEVAKPVVAWLRDQHWDVHQEVAPGGGGSSRADIVGLQGKALYVIETKVAFNIAVIEQAMNWTRSAHYVSVAVPSWCNTHGLLRWACAHHGIGILRVNGLDGYLHGPSITVEQSPRINRHCVDRRLRKILGEETRATEGAGSQFASYHTPFRKTCEGIGRVMAGRSEPITTRELVKLIKHHYATDASACSALRSWLHAGKVPGVVPLPNSKPEAWQWDDASYRATRRSA